MCDFIAARPTINAISYAVAREGIRRADPIKLKFENVLDLDAYSTRYRYPTPADNLPKPPSVEEAAAYFERLLGIVRIFTKHFQENVRPEEPEAGSVSPIR